MKFNVIESRTDKSGKIETIVTSFDSANAAKAKAYARLAEYEGSALYTRASAVVVDSEGYIHVSERVVHAQPESEE